MVFFFLCLLILLRYSKCQNSILIFRMNIFLRYMLSYEKSAAYTSGKAFFHIAKNNPVCKLQSFVYRQGCMYAELHAAMASVTA